MGSCLKKAFLALVVIAALLLIFKGGVESIVVEVASRHTVGETEGYLYDDLRDVPSTEVGIVLGASPRTEHFRRRLEAAGELYLAGKVERLLVSGDGGGEHYDETGEMLDVLLRMGIPRERVEVDARGLSTWESISRAQRVFGVDDAIVITQRFHAYRAVLIARDRGMDVEAYCARDPADLESDLDREGRARVKALLQIYLPDAIFERLPSWWD